jgi:hypothetical protein
VLDPGRGSASSGPSHGIIDLEQQLVRVSAKAPIAEEIRYGLNHWDGLTRFLEDGPIELDTNNAERGIHRLPDCALRCQGEVAIMKTASKLVVGMSLLAAACSKDTASTN